MVSNSVARAILRDIDFPENDDPTYVLAVSGKANRKTALAQGGKARRIAAALEIQRIWRGQRTRRKLGTILGSLVIPKQHKPPQRSRFAHVYAHYRQYVRWCAEQGLPQGVVLSFRDYCARIIQQWWRRLYRSHLENEQQTKSKWNLQKAVTVIQRAWRRRNDVKLFRLYRDLIMFKGRGNPSHLLRTINPLEAELLDRAAGSFVRFRLGGNTFPPSIYYKIFTHRSIVDMCAYSPRDYTAMANRWRVARDANHKNPRKVEGGSSDNWYQRWENNGWRPVSVRLFETAHDSITTETASKLKEFHHSRLQRQQDLKRRAKQRKIEWLKKMYKEGAQHTITEAAVETSHVQTADTVQEEDDDVDELLSWTNGLDFEEYLAGWSLSATSAYSDGTVCVHERLA